jgi:hypothetical protein
LQQQRSIGRHLRDEIEDGHRNSVVLGRGLVRQAERGIERCALNLGEVSRTLADGPEQLMQSGERQMRLGLHTSRGENGHAAFACRSHGLIQQARLADTGFATKDERLSVHGDVVEERRQEFLFLKVT